MNHIYSVVSIQPIKNRICFYFRVMMSATISAYKRYSVRLDPQLFADAIFMVFVYNSVQRVLTICVTWWVSYKRQELFTLREHLGSSRVSDL